MISEFANRFSTELTDAMSDTALEAAVLSTAGGPSSPAYLVIEPDVAARAEIVLFDGLFDGTTFRTSSLANRYLAGSAANSGITHPIGSKVISAPLAQMLDDLHERVTNAVPVGTIVMWSGSVASIPSGFSLCDGTNGTPDLRGRFIVGAGGAYDPGATGGLETVTLTTAQIPAHGHGASSGTVSSWHTHSGTTASQNTNHYHTQGNTGAAGGHHHDFRYGVASSVSGRYLPVYNGERANHVDPTDVILSVGDHVHATPNTNNQSHSHQHTFTTGNPSSNHTHTVTVNNTGGGGSHENRPPYYALAYIMKV